MARYYDIDKLIEMIQAKADTLIEGKEAFLYVAKWLDKLPAADVVPRSELDKMAEEYSDLIVEKDHLFDMAERLQNQVNRSKKYDEERDVRLHARLIANARAEAIKEFAERLLDKYDIWTESDATEYRYVEELVDSLVKEMTKEKGGDQE